MKVEGFPSKSTISSIKRGFQSQCVSNVKWGGEDFVSKLLDRRWTLPHPDAKIHQVLLSTSKVSQPGRAFSDVSFFNKINPSFGHGLMNKDDREPSFFIVRDDLLHPLINGNKARKLDGLIPLVEDHSVTDVVTCGGCQSAHTAAMAVSCSERGLKSHLLLRGEQPEILTGYNLISTIYGNVTYVPRSLYANREKMLKSHADYLAGSSGSVLWFDDILEASLSENDGALSFFQKDAHRSDHPRKIAIVNEGAGDVVALLGKDDREPSFFIVRDDLLHPLINGNKARKLDGLIPLVEDHSVTDVVTCGGCQSAHTAAMAVSCSERGLKSHLLLRGEQPEILTGYNLISTIYGNVTYVPRSLYANREKMLKSHADYLAGSSGSVLWFDDILEASLSENDGALSFFQKDAHRSDHPRKIAIVNEGAGDVVALLGLIRLVQYLSENHILGKERPLKLVVDAGTGTTAVGLGLGAICLGLPWEVTAVMLADTIDGYKRQEKRLISDFKRHFGLQIDHSFDEIDRGLVHWVERCHPRKFGNVLKGEVEACQRIAQQTGISVDPVYTLAAWEMSTVLREQEAGGGATVVMLHTGGTLGMFGLAQRYKSYFSNLKAGPSN